MLSIRVPAISSELLEETKWVLRKSRTEIVREAVIDYVERHLPKEALEKIRKKLASKTNTKTTKGGN